jgi:antitoxin ParD1/3/4
MRQKPNLVVVLDPWVEATYHLWIDRWQPTEAPVRVDRTERPPDVRPTGHGFGLSLLERVLSVLNHPDAIKPSTNQSGRLKVVVPLACSTAQASLKDNKLGRLSLERSAVSNVVTPSFRHNTPSMAIRKTRNVSLTPELEALVDSKVASGRYRSASEVVRTALRLLDERDRLFGSNSKNTPDATSAG